MGSRAVGLDGGWIDFYRRRFTPYVVCLRGLGCGVTGGDPRQASRCTTDWQFVVGARRLSVEMLTTEPNCQFVGHGQRRYRYSVRSMSVSVG